MQHLLSTRLTGIKGGDFNRALLKCLENKLLDIFKDHALITNEKLSRSLIDYIYIKKFLMKELFTNATVEHIYFSDQEF